MQIYRYNISFADFGDYSSFYLIISPKQLSVMNIVSSIHSEHIYLCIYIGENLRYKFLCGLLKCISYWREHVCIWMKGHQIVHGVIYVQLWVQCCGAPAVRNAMQCTWLTFLCARIVFVYHKLFNCFCGFSSVQSWAF